MLTDEPPEIYLKRRRLAKDYFQHIPEERVNLKTWSEGPESGKLLYTNGLDALKCNAVACLAGWLYTLPEYREWAKEKNQCSLDSEALRCWIGASVRSANDNLRNPFACRRDSEKHSSDKAVALARLERLIIEAEQAVRKEAV